jgi:tetratricopeptide (TPR) repeat protein
MSLLKFAEAEREADRLVADDPDNPEVLFVRGKLYHQLGQTKEAEPLYQKAVERGFKEARQWLLLIRLSAALSLDSPSQIEAGEQRLVVNPDDATTHLKLAELLSALGWPGRSLDTLEKADARFPDQAKIEIALADQYRYFARPELALPLLESALQKNPNDETIQRKLTTIQALLIEPQMEPRKPNAQSARVER